MKRRQVKGVFQNYQKIICPGSLSLFTLFTLINLNLAILFSPINACDPILLNQGNTFGCGGLYPPSCGLSLLNFLSPFQGALQHAPPQPPPTILQPLQPAYAATPFSTPLFRPPSLFAQPPIVPRVFSQPLLQTAPIVPSPRILQPVVNSPSQGYPYKLQLIPLAMCAMPCRKKVMSPSIPRTSCCNGDYCCIDCCSDDSMFMRRF